MASRINLGQHIEAWQASGLSQAAYCRLHRLSPATFSAKVRKHRDAPPPTATLPVSPALVAVRIEPVNASAVVEPLVLRTASGHCLELPATVSPGWLAELLRCLG